jgi:hypothetical protein
MSIGLFVDKNQPPAEGELLAALAQYPLWEQRQQFILEPMDGRR